MAQKKISFPIALILILALVLSLPACKNAPSANQDATSENAAIPTLAGFPDLPAEARQQTRSGDPRTPAYWSLWNSCAEENRADVAEANGGREAGWYLMDDLLANPGIQLGDLPVDTCQQGLVLLQPTVDEPEENAALVFTLAAQLLAAELNLNLGAETCPIVEEAVLGAHIYLADLGFDGTSVTADALSAERVEAISQLVDLLTVYNTGDLCVDLGD